jgi:hypothetical protein
MYLVQPLVSPNSEANNVLYALIVFSFDRESSRIFTIVSSLRNEDTFDPPGIAEKISLSALYESETT